MNETDLKNYIERINNIDKHIKFTTEFEQKCSINFLDTTITRKGNENQLHVRWFRKTTAANRLLDYNSCHQHSIKRNLVTNMATRIKDTTKDKDQLKEDTEKLKQILRNSNYPEREIQNTIKKAIQNDDTSPTKPKEKEKFKYMITLPYTPGMEPLKKKLNELNINLFFSYPNKIQSLVNKAKETRTRAVIYKIDCTCGSTHIGETKIDPNGKMKQHETLIKNKKQQTISEMVQHMNSNGMKCRFTPNQATVIDKETDWNRRRIKEAIDSIINDSINRHDDINGIWLPIINRGKERIKNRILQN